MICHENGCTLTACCKPDENSPSVQIKPTGAQTGGFPGKRMLSTSLCFYHLKKLGGYFDKSTDDFREMHIHEEKRLKLRKNQRTFISRGRRYREVGSRVLD